ncbi:hypothetical protein TWF730_008948 [Orbilia blumenaviensis]|uniref:Uncharacterized protein n=1 Tax=Orbilia blumenaviensis TaxID=1796055 RepID=A0AAV9UWZ1_9PEZI
MNTFGPTFGPEQSEGEAVLQNCIARSPPPDLTSPAILNRPKDADLVRIHGINYDIDLVYIKISPKALAVELLDLNLPDEQWKKQKLDEEKTAGASVRNQWFTPEGKWAPGEGDKARRLLPVTRAVFEVLNRRLGVTEYNGPIAFGKDGAYDPTEVEEIKIESLEEALVFIDELEKIPLRPDEAGRAQEAYIRAQRHIKAIQDKKREEMMNAQIQAEILRAQEAKEEEENYNLNYDEGSSSDSDDAYSPIESPEMLSRKRPLRNPAKPIPFGKHIPPGPDEDRYPEHFKEFTKSTYKAVRNKVASVDWTVENPLLIKNRSGADTWDIAIHDFHAERLRIVCERARPGLFKNRPTSITANFGPEFDLYDPRLWVLDDDTPEPDDDPSEFARFGQNSLQYMMDIMRIKWHEMAVLDLFYVDDPAYNTSDFDDNPTEEEDKYRKKFPTPGFRTKEPIIHTFDRMTANRRAVLNVALKLFITDLDIPNLDADLRELAKYAIFKYIDADPPDDIQMRESLLVLWELTKVITIITGEQQQQQQQLGRSEECTC